MFLPVFSFLQFFDALYTPIWVALMYVFPYLSVIFVFDHKRTNVLAIMY